MLCTRIRGIPLPLFWDRINMIKFIGAALNGKGSLLYYLETEGKNNFLKFIRAENGLEFTGKQTNSFIFDLNLHEEQDYALKSLKLSKQDSEYFLTYKQNAKKSQLSIALSEDLIRWQKLKEIKDIKETAAIVSDYKHQNKYVMYYGEKEINIAYSEDLRAWKTDGKAILNPRKSHFDSSNLEVAGVYKQAGLILVIYYAKKQDTYSVGAAYFASDDPSVCIWRSEDPIWEIPASFKEEKLTPLGTAIIENELILYWLAKETSIFAVTCQIPSVKDVPNKKAFSAIVKKHKNNPIIAPRSTHPWESRATFNSAAIYEDGKVHFLYRALGDKDLSVLGYAASSDGFTLDERSDEPAYFPREPFETPGGNIFNTFAEHFASGGGYGGIEDPRATRVDDTIYLTYVAFDGATNPRLAISSIDIEDFLKKNWENWKKPKLISSPGITNKSAVILPRKVKGKYVVYHRIYPNILVDYVDNLDFDEYLQGHYFIAPRKNNWDSKKVGAGAPPMETKDGWLMIYQSVGHQDPHRYKIGAMMLDKDNPSKVLYRTNAPIIEPEESYENEGFKSGVVYPCGSVIMNNQLNIYYGGADTFLCAASADLDTFLDEMKHRQEPKLSKVSVNIFN
jgi:beta-1,2-mannobiose phosphorylase / 1,2-beta-oligomannan phosphorylase